MRDTVNIYCKLNPSIKPITDDTTITINDDDNIDKRIDFDLFFLIFIYIDIAIPKIPITKSIEAIFISIIPCEYIENAIVLDIKTSPRFLNIYLTLLGGLFFLFFLIFVRVFGFLLVIINHHVNNITFTITINLPLLNRSSSIFCYTKSF